VNSNNSQNIYFVQFQTNSVLYKAQIDVYFMPSSANATLYGYQKPEGATWNFPATNTMVQITINDNLISDSLSLISQLNPSKIQNKMVSKCNQIFLAALTNHLEAVCIALMEKGIPSNIHDPVFHFFVCDHPVRTMSFVPVDFFANPARHVVPCLPPANQ
jgi:hypothetical protein